MPISTFPGQGELKKKQTQKINTYPVFFPHLVLLEVKQEPNWGGGRIGYVFLLITAFTKPPMVKSASAMPHLPKSIHKRALGKKEEVPFVRIL